MQQSSTIENPRRREGVAEDCCMLSILLAVPSCFDSLTYRADKHPSNLAVLHVTWTDSGLEFLQETHLKLIQALDVGEYGLQFLSVKQLCVESALL